MVHGHTDDGKPQGDVDAGHRVPGLLLLVIYKSHHLKGDVPLVMIDVYKRQILYLPSCSSTYFLSLGSRASRSPSPIKFRANMVMLIASAGNSIW